MNLKPLIVTCLSVAASTVLQTSVEAATRTATISDVNVAFALAEIYPTPNVVSRSTRTDADAVKARGKLVVQTDTDSLDERTNRLKVVHSYAVAVGSRKISNADIIKAVLQVNGQANTSAAGWALNATPVFDGYQLVGDKVPTADDPTSLPENHAALTYNLYIKKGKLRFEVGSMVVGPILAFSGTSVDVEDLDTKEVLVDTRNASGVYYNGTSFRRAAALNTKLNEVATKITNKTATNAEIAGREFLAKFGFSGLYQGASATGAYVHDDANKNVTTGPSFPTGGEIAVFPRTLSNLPASNARYTGTIAFGASKMVVTVND